MSKNRKFEKQLEENKVVEEPVEETIESSVEEVTENAIEETVETIEEPVVEEVIEETSDEIQLEVIGTVEGCELLNVRSKPEADAEIVTVIPVDSIVTVSDVNASPDFYKVLIGDLEGFCMKKFIKIKE